MTLKRVEAGFAPILELLKASFAVMDGRIDPPSSLHRLDVAGVARQATEGEIWAIYSTGAPIACVFLTKRPDTLYLGKLAVAPDRQREGLGRRLVDCALTRARALALPSVTLEARIELTEVHAFYHALGFAEVGRTAHPGYDRPTSVTLRRSIDIDV